MLPETAQNPRPERHRPGAVSWGLVNDLAERGFGPGWMAKKRWLPTTLGETPFFEAYIDLPVGLLPVGTVPKYTLTCATPNAALYKLVNDMDATIGQEWDLQMANMAGDLDNFPTYEEWASAGPAEVLGSNMVTVGFDGPSPTLIDMVYQLALGRTLTDPERGQWVTHFRALTPTAEKPEAWQAALPAAATAWRAVPADTRSFNGPLTRADLIRVFTAHLVDTVLTAPEGWTSGRFGRLMAVYDNGCNGVPFRAPGLGGPG